MIIYSLGRTLQKVTQEEFLMKKESKEINVEEASAENRIKEREGYLFICEKNEAQLCLQMADIIFDGIADPSLVEFCKVESLPECIAGTLEIPKLSDICGSTYKIQFFVNRKNIVIVDNSNFSAKIVRRIISSKTKQGQTRERFLYNFLTNILSRDLSLLNRYERSIMSLEEEVANNIFEKYKQDAYEIRKQLLVLREYYDEMCDLGKQLEEDENRIFIRKNLKYFGTVSDRADRLMNRAMYLLEYIMQIRDFYNQKISDRQSKNMEFLTVISTIFFPLTLITGWFGMNFENMPELKHGYPYVWMFSAVMVICILLLLKKKKII